MKTDIEKVYIFNKKNKNNKEVNGKCDSYNISRGTPGLVGFRISRDGGFTSWIYSRL